MIFVNEELEASERVFSLGTYLPTWHMNFRQDSFSRMLLDVKYREEDDPDPAEWKVRKKAVAIAHFSRRLDEKLADGIAVAVVPSHAPDREAPSGIAMIARRLAAAKGRVDVTGCLVRHTAVPKLATGGHRDVDVHLGSIKVENAELIRGREVLLLDDVMTSGGSLEACARLLLEAGAARVRRAVLGETISAY